MLHKKLLLLIVLTLAIPSSILYAKTYNQEDLYLQIGGDTLGISLSDGVYVEGTYKVATSQDEEPYLKSNIKKGDKIIRLGNYNISTVNDLKTAMVEIKDTNVKIMYLRDNKVNTGTITPSLTTKNSYSLGLYVRDSVTGVGTLTYILPETQEFGALGHQINSSIDTGIISKADVTSFDRGEKNNPGSKKAIHLEKIGTVNDNDMSGIFGTLLENPYDNKLYQIKTNDQVEKGKAYIYTTLEDDIVRPYEIQITHVYEQDSKDIKSFKYKVVDKTLLKTTGGIVQGMSGSPIVQDNKIIGAVTHVLVKNPKVGYGIYIEWMLETQDVYVS